jgi:hypothetical protein
LRIHTLHLLRSDDPRYPQFSWEIRMRWSPFAEISLARGNADTSAEAENSGIRAAHAIGLLPALGEILTSYVLKPIEGVSQAQPEEPARAIRTDPKVVSQPTSAKEARPSPYTVAPPLPPGHSPVFVRDELLGVGAQRDVVGNRSRLSRCANCLQVFLTLGKLDDTYKVCAEDGEWVRFTCSPQCRDDYLDARREAGEITRTVHWPPGDP